MLAGSAIRDLEGRIEASLIGKQRDDRPRPARCRAPTGSSSATTPRSCRSCEDGPGHRRRRDARPGRGRGAERRPRGVGVDPRRAGRDRPARRARARSAAERPTWSINCAACTDVDGAEERPRTTRCGQRRRRPQRGRARPRRGARRLPLDRLRLRRRARERPTSSPTRRPARRPTGARSSAGEVETARGEPAPLHRAHLLAVRRRRRATSWTRCCGSAAERDEVVVVATRSAAPPTPPTWPTRWSG